MTANDPFGRTPSTDLVTLEPSPVQSDKVTLSQCVQQIKAAFDELQHVQRDRLTASLVLGTAAGTARDVLPKGEFGRWVDANFDGDKFPGLSIQWIRKCINAAEVSHRIERSPKREAILAKFNTVEKLGAILNDLVAGVDVLALTYGQAPAKMGRPKSAPKLVIDRSPQAKDDPEPEARDNLDVRAAALDRREKMLDAKETRLQAWEDDLTRRAALLDAHAVTDVVAKSPIDDLKAQKLAADAKTNAKARRAAGSAVTDAPASPTPAAGSARKRRVDPKVAPSPKTAPTQPVDTVAAPDPAPIETAPEAGIVPMNEGTPPDAQTDAEVL